MQRKKCEGRPKNISRTHIPCKLQYHVLNMSSMKRWGGEYHLYRTAYRKFTYKCKKENYLPQNMLLVA